MFLLHHIHPGIIHFRYRIAAHQNKTEWNGTEGHYVTEWHVPAAKVYLCHGGPARYASKPDSTEAFTILIQRLTHLLTSHSRLMTICTKFCLSHYSYIIKSRDFGGCVPVWRLKSRTLQSEGEKAQSEDWKAVPKSRQPLRLGLNTLWTSYEKTRVIWTVGSEIWKKLIMQCKRPFKF